MLQRKQVREMTVKHARSHGRRFNDAREIEQCAGQDHAVKRMTTTATPTAMLATIST
jgi:hypothetical protein